MGIAWLERKRARRGWVLLGIAAIAVLGLWGWNHSLREIELTGFELPGADWIVYSDNMPEAWERLENSALFERIDADAPEALSELNVWLRRTTGIRWTPSRWRRWLGEPAVISVRGEEVCASFHPGPLPWLPTLLVRQRLQPVPGEPALVPMGNWYAAWKDSFLIVGSSPSIVRDLLLDGGGKAYSTAPGTVGLVIFDEPFPRVLAELSDELAMTVEMRMDDAGSLGRNYLAVDWPDAPIVSARVRDAATWKDLLPETWPEFPGKAEFEETWQNFQELLPPEWDAGADSLQFALFDVDTSANVPVPDAAIYARSEAALAPLAPPARAIPYEWSGNAGWMTPWLGDDMQLFVVANDRARAFTNREPTMARLMARERAGRVTSNEAEIEIDAARLARVLRDLAWNAADNELWPERNRDDVDRDIVPWINALGALGEIRLEGEYENGNLVLRGGTRAPEASEAGK